MNTGDRIPGYHPKPLRGIMRLHPERVIDISRWFDYRILSPKGYKNVAGGLTTGLFRDTGDGHALNLFEPSLPSHF